MAAIWIVTDIDEKWITQFAIWKVYMCNILNNDSISEKTFYIYIMKRQLIKETFFLLVTTILGIKGLIVLTSIDGWCFGYFTGIWIQVGGITDLNDIFCISVFEFIMNIILWIFIIETYQNIARKIQIKNHKFILKQKIYFFGIAEIICIVFVLFKVFCIQILLFL